MNAPALASAAPSAAPALLAGTGNSLSFQGLNQLSALARSDPHSPAAIAAVSRQFEALLVQQMLQSANAVKLGPDLLGGTGGPLFESLFTQQVASTVSQGAGIGLASLLARELSARYGQARQAAGSAPSGHGAASAPPPTPTRPAATAAAAPPPAADAAGSPGLQQQARRFIASILPSARAAAKALGVSPLGILAQAALETGWGRHAPGHNLFGIKASGGWQGASLQALTSEVESGLSRLGSAAFRAYRSAAASVRDYASLLQSPRYAPVRGHGSNLAAFAQALQGSGYATDPQYASKLLEVAHSPLMRDALASLADAGGSSVAVP